MHFSTRLLGVSYAFSGHESDTPSRVLGCSALIDGPTGTGPDAALVAYRSRQDLQLLGGHVAHVWAAAEVGLSLSV